MAGRLEGGKVPMGFKSFAIAQAAAKSVDHESATSLTF